MSMVSPAREWWTAADLAAAGLPDLPTTRQGIDDLAARLGWRGHPEFARRRKGRGGGWEYHWRLLPQRAQQRLLAERQAGQKPAPAVMDRDEAWAWFESLPERARDDARERLRIIQAVDAMEALVGRDAAVRDVAQAEGVGARTLWGWLARIDGVAAADRLPWLADRRHDGSARRALPRGGSVAEPAAEFLDLICSDYLRLSRPSFSTVYRRQLRVAKAKGYATLPERTMRRRLDASVSRVTQILRREGIEKVQRLYPAQQRDKTAMHALEAVNADYHKWDVFVRWPAEDGSSECYIGRPQMVAFQDIHSGRILSWKVDQTANSTTVLLAAGDMITDWGIPEHVLFDNGREFAAKDVTGGAQNRYRFKVNDNDIPGLFTSLGCTIHWATPYSGQSKPIERAFRDMCDAIARDPRFDGAWTGNRPDAKPEDHGSRAIDLDDFLRVVAEGIEEHNTRRGRRSEVAWGRSFAEVFDESYANAPIRKATEAQRRLWLMGARGLTTHSRTGEISFMENRYWSPWLNELPGTPVVVRFDPADLWAGLHVYGFDGRYLGHAETLERAGFFDMAEARVLARARRAWLKAERDAAKAHVRYSAAELGQELDRVSPVEPAPPTAQVIRIMPDKVADKAFVRGRPRKSSGGEQPGTVTALPQRDPAPIPTPTSARDLFRRALELEQAIEAGRAVTREQKRWLEGYQTTPEYRVERRLWETHGDTLFGQSGS